MVGWGDGVEVRKSESASRLPKSVRGTLALFVPINYRTVKKVLL